MRSVPTLDALAECPELARALPRDVAFQLHLKAQAVATLCALALAGGAELPERPPEDRLLTTAEVCGRLQRSRNWVLGHKRELGALQDGEGKHPRFPESAVLGYIAGRVATAARKGV